MYVHCTLYSTINGHAVIRLGYKYCIQYAIIIEHGVCHYVVVGCNSSGIRNIFNEIRVQQLMFSNCSLECGIGMFSY